MTRLKQKYINSILKKTKSARYQTNIFILISPKKSRQDPRRTRTNRETSNQSFSRHLRERYLEGRHQSDVGQQRVCAVSATLRQRPPPESGQLLVQRSGGAQVEEEVARRPVVNVRVIDMRQQPIGGELDAAVSGGSQGLLTVEDRSHTCHGTCRAAVRQSTPSYARCCTASLQRQIPRKVKSSTHNLTFTWNMYEFTMYCKACMLCNHVGFLC